MAKDWSSVTINPKSVALKAGDGLAIMKTGFYAGVGMLALGIGAAAFGAGMDAGFGE